MRPVVVTAVQAKPLVTQQIKKIPERVTGLYRFSIRSKRPFGVDIGGGIMEKARTLDVFHETPMFIDSIKNLASMDLLKEGQITRMIRLHPMTGTEPLQFRITAHEDMAERHEFERKKILASIETPMEQKGLVKLIYETIREDEHDEMYFPREGKIDLSDPITAALVLCVTAGAALAISSIMLAATAAPVYAPALVLACDPSRTYINGRLFKNLKEVKVKISQGAIVGYTHP